MAFDLQPTITGKLVQLRPLRAQDREPLFAVASDPDIWAQHPIKDRSERPGFNAFFDESLESGGALVIIDRDQSEIIGATRYHGFNPDAREVEIGWTFLARDYWGGRVNGEVKSLMLEHAFQYVDHVVFLIAPDNVRSRRAVEKIGAVPDGRRRDAAGRESVVYRISSPDGNHS